MKSDPVLLANGELYAPAPVKDGNTAMRAVVHMMLKHTADMLVTMVDIVAEEHGLNKDEMMETIIQHPKYKDMYVNPVIYDLGYLPARAAADGVGALKLDSAAAAAAPVAAAVASSAGSVTSDQSVKKGWSEETKRKAAEKRAATKAAKAAAAAMAPAAVEPDVEMDAAAAAVDAAPAAPKKRVFKIKPKMAAGSDAE